MTDTLILEMSREGTKLKMGVFERAKQTDAALRHYTELDITDREVTELCDDVTELLRKANRHGILEQSLITELKKAGQLLYDQLLTFEVKEKLHQLQPGYLIFSIDEKLVQIPWELLFDGEEFLCFKYSIGRSVRTKQKPHSIKLRSPVASPARMLILADPTGDLEEAYHEGIEIRNELDKRKNRIKVDLHTTELDLRFVKKNIRDYDIIHFAGHADYNDENPSDSGWLFKDGKLTSDDIVQLGASVPLPSVVFSNACQSGRTEEWKIERDFEERIYGLANAFLLTGVKHYIGTFWKVADESSFLFSKEFYKRIADGMPIGDAVKLAREALAKEYGEDSIVWASYMLYGDPSTTLFPTQVGTVPYRKVGVNQKTKYLIFGILAFIAILGITLNRFFLPSPPQIQIATSLVPKDKIVVMPFTNISGEESSDWLSDGIASVIATKLYNSQKILVIDKQNADNVLKELKTAKYVDKETAIKTAKILGANKVVLGNFQRLGNQTRITAELILVETGKTLDVAEATGNYEQMFQLQDQISLSLIEKLDIKLSNKEKEQVQKPFFTKSISAFELLTKANRAFSSGDNEKSLELCLQALEADPNFHQAILGLGQIYEKKGDLENSRKYFEKYFEVVKESPDDNERLSAYFNVGRIYGRLGDPDKGLGLEKTALDIAVRKGDLQSEALIFTNMAFLQLMKNDVAAAENSLKNSQAIYERLNDRISIANTYLALGFVYSDPKYDNLTQSIGYFEKALNIFELTNNNQGKLLINTSLGNIYATRGLFEKAKESFTNGLLLSQKLNDKSAEADIKINLATILRQLGQFEDSKQLYEKSLELSKAAGNQLAQNNALYGLYQLYMTQTRNEEAIKYLDLIIASPNSENNLNAYAQAMYERANLYTKMGKYLEANRDFEILLTKETLIKNPITLSQIYLGYGKSTIILKGPEAAMAYFKKSIDALVPTKNHINVAYAYRQIADSLLESNQLDQAILFYKKAISYHDKSIATQKNNQLIDRINNSGLVLTYDGLARVYQRKKDTDKARLFFDKALKIAEAEKDSLVQTIRNELYWLDHGTDLEKAEIRNPDAQFLYEEALNSIVKREYQEADKKITAALAKEPNAIKILEAQGDVSLKLGQYEKALATHFKLAELLKKDVRRVIDQYISIAFNYDRLLDYKSSLEYYEKARELAEKNNDKEKQILVYSAASGTYQGAGQGDTAIEYANKAIQISKEVNRDDYLINAYGTLSGVYSSKGEAQKSLEYAKLGLEISERIGSPSLGESYARVAGAYRNTDALKSIEYFTKAVDFFRSAHDERREGNVYGSLGSIYEQMSQNEKALEYYKKSLQIAEKYNDKWTALSTLIIMPGLYNKLGDHENAQAMEKKCFELLVKLPENEDTAIEYQLLGLSIAISDPTEAEKHILKSIEILQKLNSLRSKKALESSVYFLADFYCKQKNFEKGLIYYGKALEYAKTGNDQKRIAAFYIVIGLVRANLKDYSGALDSYRKAHEILTGLKDTEAVKSLDQEIQKLEKYQSEVKDYNEQKIASDLVARAQTYVLNGNMELALANVQKALVIFKKNDDKQMTAASLRIMAGIYLSKREQTKAQDLLNEALLTANETKDKESIAMAHGAVALFFEQVGKYEDSEKELNKAVASLGDSNMEKPYWATYYQCLGTLNYKKGNFKEAVANFEKSIEANKEFADPRVLSFTYLMAGYVSYKANKFDEAASFFKSASEFAEPINEQKTLALSSLLIGKVQTSGDFSGRKSYYEKAIEHANLEDDKLLQCIVYSETARFMKAAGTSLEEYQKYLNMAKAVDSFGIIVSDDIKNDLLDAKLKEFLDNLNFFYLYWL